MSFLVPVVNSFLCGIHKDDQVKQTGQLRVSNRQKELGSKRGLCLDVQEVHSNIRSDSIVDSSCRVLSFHFYHQKNHKDDRRVDIWSLFGVEMAEKPYRSLSSVWMCWMYKYTDTSSPIGILNSTSCVCGVIQLFEVRRWSVPKILSIPIHISSSFSGNLNPYVYHLWCVQSVLCCDLWFCTFIVKNLLKAYFKH